MKRNDVILIASLLVLGFLSMFIISVMNTEDISKVAVIHIDNREVYKIPINNGNGEKRVDLEFSGRTGYLDIKDGAVKMEEMEIEICPQKICSETGWISKPYETIVCLPNKIVVSIENIV
ncbi:MAG: hypothetical protein APF77_21525 [Clostridia bacterium BRH_c25]|nr:MAG: hypothetical protein APF77_21525 [Clostridia bacterium BRH_c25]